MFLRHQPSERITLDINRALEQLIVPCGVVNTIFKASGREEIGGNTLMNATGLVERAELVSSMYALTYKFTVMDKTVTQLAH